MSQSSTQAGTLVPSSSELRSEPSTRTLLPDPEVASAAIEALDAVNDAYLSFDHDWRVTYVNASAERIVGIARADMIGRCAWDIFPELVGTTLHESYLRAVREQVEIDLEWYSTTLPGWFDVRARPSAHGLTVVFRDVTRHKQAEDDLKGAEQHFRMIVEHIDAATYRHVIDRESNAMTIYMSPQIERITGYPARAWNDDREFGISIVHPDDRDYVRQAVNDAIRHNHGLNVEYRYVRPDNGIVWARNIGSFVEQDGATRIWQGIILDISEKKHTEERLRESEVRYRTIWEHAPIGISAADPDGRIRYANPALAALLGYTTTELQQMTIEDLTHPDDREAVRSRKRKLNVAAGQENSYSADERYLRKDGTAIWCEVAVSVVRDDAGQVEQTIAMIEDVTERITARERLIQAEARYRGRVEQVPAAVYTTEPFAPDGSPTPTTYISPQLEMLTGYPVENWLTTPDFTSRIMHPEDAERRLAEIQRCEQAGGNFRIDYRIIHRDGHAVWLRNESTLIEDDAGNPLFWQGIIIDISEQQALQQALQHQAMHDVLTGLPNRALLLDRTHQALALRRRTGEQIAVLFLDLDNFKVINDSLGHAAGDEMLVAIAERLQECVREGDTVSRLGGDEFAILLTRLSDLDGVLEVVRRITGSFQTPLSIYGRSITGATSIGIAIATDDDDPGDVLRKADIAMYRAKAQGKNRYAMFDARMHADAVNRLDLEHDLRRALESQELVLYYQPQIDFGTGDIIGMEALLRWNHPDRGLLSPGAFIPIAEDSGLIGPLGAWVLRTACEQAKSWREHGSGPATMKMCVNLSAREFRQPGLIDQVRSVLDETGVDPSHLVIEITETAVMDDVNESVERLGALHDLGVEMSIDDFGMGYSSLAYLKRFPVDVLKIDRSFIAGLGRSDEDTAIVSAIISLAHTLNLSVVAEGVETEEQVDQLRHLGCDRAQGYLFARPLPADLAQASFD